MPKGHPPYWNIVHAGTKAHAFMRVASIAIALCVAVQATSFAQEPNPDRILEKHPGAAIYTRQCADCHGARGEGIEGKADEPLTGNRSLESLARRIERTMPEGEEDMCIGEDANAVAEYIYQAFYSLEARARNTPARVELARLTVPQFRATVADLVGSFYGGYGNPLTGEPGLKGRYDGSIKERAGRAAKPGDKFERVDRRIRFDFREGIPEMPEGKMFDPISFRILWEGVIIPEETGEHEFKIRTRNGAQLWVNERSNDEEALIDGWVAPHNDLREQTGSIYLIAGRAYPIELDFFKYKEKAAAIELLWKPPHGVWHHVPARVLRTDRRPETMVVSTPFPADDRSVGYERGTAVSKAWFDAVTQAAIETAEYVSEHLDELARTNAKDQNRDQDIRDFAAKFTERAFRRPISDRERQQIVEARFAEAETPEQAVKRLALFVLTSPEFLYPELDDGEAPDSWDVAATLALVLWDSIPDAPLENQARAGKLVTPQIVRIQARRMLKDPRAKVKMHGFFEHWLELERADDLAKDEKTFPDFNEAVLADLRTSLKLFLDDVVWKDERSDYRELLLADYLYLNPRLAKLYGNAPVDGSGFRRVSMEPNRRTGIVTHPFLLASFAYHNSTSPIHRGVFLTRNVVGMTLKSPPEANLFEDSKFDPNFTMREKVTELTRSKACMACHVTINPLGFSLENYDGIGRWQTKDNGKPVRATSKLKTDTGETLKLSGARDVATLAASRPSAHEAFVEQLFHHLVKQPVAAYGKDELRRLRDHFENSEFNIQELMVEMSAISVARKVADRKTGSKITAK